MIINNSQLFKMDVSTYDHLDDAQIRLVTLHPGPESAAIACTLRKISLDDPELEYVALSWTWDTEYHGTKRIKLNGRDFEARPNLYEALHALRKHGGQQPQDIWIDALCINQDNSSEKSKQIPLMTQIYSCARFVTVWLGPARDDSDFVMDCIRQQRDQAASESRFSKGFPK
jgi:hypothetical protein